MFKLVLLVLTLAAARAHFFGLENELVGGDLKTFEGFSRFAQLHGKKYADLKETRLRFKVYKSNQERAKVLQQDELGTAIYGETKFMDLTPEEFKIKYLSKVPIRRSDNLLPLAEVQGLLDEPLPSSIDFRKEGYVTPVKDQGSCGSCWAFSAVANIEGLWKAKTGELLSLSEQELLDCDRVDDGCDGGLMLDAYKEIIRLGGLASEADYPYKARENYKCNLTAHNLVAFINGSVSLPKNESAIQAYLVKKGPLAIAVNADYLMLYKSGIIQPGKGRCSPKSLDHGVTLVGYGLEHGKAFWIVKNSWGASFGEKGYFRIYRGDNTCGVAEYVVSAVIE